MEREVSIDSILKEELKNPKFRREFEIENGNNINIETVYKLAIAMGKKVTINIE